MDIIAMLKSLFGMTEAVSTELTQRDAENNTPEMQAAARNKQQSEMVDGLRTDIKNEDIAALRKDLAAPGSNPNP